MAPWIRTDTVRPMNFTPVAFTTLAPPADSASSTRSAYPSLSSEKVSMSEIGLAPVDYFVID